MSGNFSTFILLAVLSMLPLACSLVFSLLPARRPDKGAATDGNPLLTHVRLQSPPLSGQPYCRLARTLDAGGLCEYVIGARHVPLRECSSLLTRSSRSPDPELQLYAQAALREKVDAIQSPLIAAESRWQNSPAHTANFLDAGLAALRSPLAPESEHPALLKKLQPAVDAALSPDADHPRLLSSAAQVLLIARRLDDAESLARRLPEKSPLREALGRRLSHHCAIVRATVGNPASGA